MQQQSLQTFNQQNQPKLNTEQLKNIGNAAVSSASAATSSQSNFGVINPNSKPTAGSLFPTELAKQQQQTAANSFGFPQNPYGGGFDQYSANNNIFARTPLTDFAYQAGQTFYSGVRQVWKKF